MKKLFYQIILPVIAIAGILGFITIFNPIQQQHAAWARPGTQQYPCGSNLTVLLTPNYETTCDSNGYNHNMTHYQSSVTIKAAAGSVGAYAVHWKWATFWCPTEDPSAPCHQYEVDSNSIPTNEGLTGNNVVSVTAYSPDRSAEGQFAGLACGYYQNDFAFYVTNNNNPNTPICGISLSDPFTSNNNASWCHTGNTCTLPSPTPTSVPTSTPTPTSVPTSTPTPGVTITPTDTPTPTLDCDGDSDGSDPSNDQQCLTPTPTNTPTPTMIPTATPTGVNTNNCDNTAQIGNGNNNNCNQNNNNNNSNSNSNQNQSQTQNNNQTVNITLNGQGQQQQQQQQVLGASTAPTQLPNTGAEGDVLFGLLGLIPVGWKIRKLI